MYDYSSSHCPGETEDFPDMTAKVFADATGAIQMIAGNSIPNRRFIGDSISTMRKDCTDPIMRSEFNTDVSASRDFSWIMSPYLVETDSRLPIVALVHNEFHGYANDRHPSFTKCKTDDESKYFRCWWGSVNLAVSLNNGKTYVQAPSPSHIVSSIGFQYSENNKEHYGAMEPSNIVYRNGYYYSLVTVQSPTQISPFVRAGTCLMRTKSLLAAKSWRYWDGKGYTIPAEQATTCVPVMPSGWSLGLTYNEYLNQYISFGCHWQSASCMKFSSDLITWTSTETQLKAAGYYAYGSMIQPGDLTRNFEVSGRSPWFYFVSCGNGVNANYCSGPDRDLKRVRIRFNKSNDIGKYPILDLQFNEFKGNKALDSSFYVNDAQLIDEATFGIESAYRFIHLNGKSKLIIPHAKSLSLNDTFSIKVRLRTSMKPGAGNYPTILNKAITLKRNYSLFMTPLGKMHFSTMNGTNFSGTVAANNMNDGMWHEHIIIFNNQTQKVSYYLDNVLDSVQSQVSTLSNSQNEGDLVIGADGFVGDIDYLQIFNYAIK